MCANRPGRGVSTTTRSARKIASEMLCVTKTIVWPLSCQSRSKSRFSVLETSGSFARKREGVEKTKDGVENLVQKDEQDPLGTYPSVVQVLRQRGLSVEDDIKLRMSSPHLPYDNRVQC